MERNYEVRDEMEIDLKAVFFELLNNWFMIVISTVLVAAIAFCGTKFLMTPMYQSTSELYVLNSNTITSIADIQIGNYMTKDYEVVVKGRPVLEQVIDNLELKMNYKQLKSKISLRIPENTRILQITVTDANPNRAKAIADEMANVVAAYIEEKMAQKAPSILSYGYADGGVVSPSISRNTMLGAIIGACLAMAIIIISYLVNDTIMTAEDVERKLGLNVLGTLPLRDKEKAHKEKNAANKADKSKK